MLAERLEAGVEQNTALAELRAAGATPVDTIKTIRQVLDVELGKAKRIFLQCSAWKREVEAADELHSEIIAVLDKDKIE